MGFQDLAPSLLFPCHPRVLPCSCGPRWLITTSVLQLPGVVEERANYGCSHCLRTYLWNCTRHVGSQAIGHTSLQGRLGNVIFILGSQVLSQIILTWKEKWMLKYGSLQLRGHENILYTLMCFSTSYCYCWYDSEKHIWIIQKMYFSSLDHPVNSWVSNIFPNLLPVSTGLTSILIGSLR